MFDTNILSRFYSKATQEEKTLVESALKDKNYTIAREVIDKVIGKDITSDMQLLVEIPKTPPGTLIFG